MNDNHELFEAFLQGNMSAAERTAFEARLLGEADLAHEFGDFRATLALVEVAGEQRLIERLNALHEELHAAGPKGRVVPMFPRTWLAIAASLVITVGAAYFFLGRTQSPEELYAEHISPYAAPDIARSGDVLNNEAWERFGDLYSTRRYNDALHALDEVTAGSVPGYLVDFYRGQCLLLKTDPDPRGAIGSFETVLATANDLHASTHWYIALAALKAEDVPLARTHLNALVGSGGYKSGEAQRLMDALPE